MMTDTLEFSYRAARSGAITAAIIAVIVIESAAVHFAVVVRSPLVAWILTLSSLAAVLWLVRDYQALGTGTIRLDDNSLRLEIGRRFDIAISLGTIARVLKPSFRDLPALGTNQGRDYLNLTKPSAPNVLIVLDAVQRVRLTAGLHRDVRRLGLRVDEPAAFLSAVEARRASLPAQSA